MFKLDDVKTQVDRTETVAQLTETVQQLTTSLELLEGLVNKSATSGKPLVNRIFSVRQFWPLCNSSKGKGLIHVKIYVKRKFFQKIKFDYRAIKYQV